MCFVTKSVRRRGFDIWLGLISCAVGTLKYATLHPKIPDSLFTDPRGRPLPLPRAEDRSRCSATRCLDQRPTQEADRTKAESEEEYDAIDDTTLMEVAEDPAFTTLEYGVTDSLSGSKDQLTWPGKQRATSKPSAVGQSNSWQPKRMANGRWRCKHNCKKDCKHVCCNEGLEKKPKPPKTQDLEQEEHHSLDIFLKVSKADAKKSAGWQKPTNFKANDGNSRGRTQKRISTAYGGDLDSSDDFESGSPTAFNGISGLSPRKGPSAFLSSTSDPKRSQVEVVSVGGLPFSESPRPIDERLFKLGSSPPPKKQRTLEFGKMSENVFDYAPCSSPEDKFAEDCRSPGDREGQLYEEELDTGKGVEGRKQEATFASADHKDYSQSEKLESADFEPWDVEAEDLFGHPHPSVEQADQTCGIHQKSESYAGLEDDDFNDVFGAQGTFIPQDNAANTHAPADEEAVAFEEDLSTAGPSLEHSVGGPSKTRALTRAPTTSESAQAESGTQGTPEPDKTSDFDDWLMKEFGHCIEFV